MVGVAQVSVASGSAGGASADEKHLAFEVLSIRRSNGASGPQFGATPDGFHAINLPMFAIFQMAYGPANGSGLLRGDRIVGFPDWLKGVEHYDVVAKVDEADLAGWQRPELRQTMLRTMLQTMLAERCKVVVHHESKEMAVYDLVVAKGGPKFKQAETMDAVELKEKHPNGGRVTGGGMAVMGSSGTQFYGVSMAWLTQTMLPGVAGKPVVDKTGLTGRYDLALPSSVLLPPLPPGASQASGAPPPLNAPPTLSPEEGESGESIFTALPEALGLRLVPAKGQVEMLVIDHVERPTEN
jgi:bla regulator protein BlaR1